MARILTKFYGFDTYEASAGSRASTPATSSRRGEGVDEQSCSSSKSVLSHERRPSIRVCCTYSWEGGRNSNSRSELAETVVTSQEESSGGASALSGSESDCEVDHFGDTHDNVERCLKWLAHDLSKGDTLVLYFSGCSTYKCVERDCKGEGEKEEKGEEEGKTVKSLEPVLCLGDFDWDDNRKGFLTCDAIYRLLLKEAKSKACELTIVLDTYLGSSMAELLNELVMNGGEVAESSGRLLHVGIKYPNLPRNRARALPLDLWEKRTLRSRERNGAKGKRTASRGWNVLAQALRIRKHVFGGLGRVGKRLRMARNHKVTPLIKKSGGGEMSGGVDGEGQDLTSSQLGSPIPMSPFLSDDGDGKVLILALEPLLSKPVFFVGGRIEKVRNINMVKLGHLCWVLYSILKDRMANTQVGTVSRIVETLHPSLGDIKKQADELMKPTWVDKLLRTKSFQCITKTIGFDGDDSKKSNRSKLFSNVYSEELLVDRMNNRHPLESMRRFSLRQEIGRHVGADPPSDSLLGKAPASSQKDSILENAAGNGNKNGSTYTSPSAAVKDKDVPVLVAALADLKIKTTTDSPNKGGPIVLPPLEKNNK